MSPYVVRTRQSLKVHVTYLHRRRREAIVKHRRAAESFDFAADSSEGNHAARERLLAALMNENSRLVDRLRSAMRELHALGRSTADYAQQPFALVTKAPR
jgi:hypothetical protein